MLNNALRQTGWGGGELIQESWREAIRTRLRGIDWTRIVADVRPFLEIPGEVDLLTEETVFKVLGRQGDGSRMSLHPEGSPC
jgi:hypothetical protein